MSSYRLSCAQYVAKVVPKPKIGVRAQLNPNRSTLDRIYLVRFTGGWVAGPSGVT